MKMAMEHEHKRHEESSPIYDDLSLLSVLMTSADKPAILHYDGSVSVFFEYDGVNNTSMTEMDIEKMFQRVKNSVEDLDPADITLSFTMVRDSNVGIKDVTILPSFLQPRATYLNNLADNYMLFMNKFYMTIHCKSKNKFNDNLLKKFWNTYVKNKNNQQIMLENAHEGLANRLSKVMTVLENMTDMMKDIGCEIREFETPDEYTKALAQFVQPRMSKIRDPQVDYNDQELSGRQQLFGSVRARNKLKDFTLDEYFHKVYMLERAPTQIIFGKSIELLESFPAEFIYTVSFRTTTKEEFTKTFHTAMRDATVREDAANSGAEIKSRIEQEELRRIDEAYQLAVADGNTSGILMSSLFVLRIKEEFIERLKRVQNKTREEVIRSYDNDLMKNVFQKFGLSEWACEDKTQWQLFCQCIPGMADIYIDVLKPIFVISKDIAYFLPLFDNKREYIKHNGTNHFVDTKGNRINFDLLDPRMVAWNYSISGQTGSGKSVLVNAILTMQFAEMAFNASKKPVICILDVGGDRGSYTKFMKLVGGEQINLSRSVKPSIQMFSLIPDRSLPTPEKLTEIAGYFLEEQNNNHNKGKASTVTMGQMEKVVQDYYYKKLDKTPDDLADKLVIRKMFQENFEFNLEPKFLEKLELKPGECVPDPKTMDMILAVFDVILSSHHKETDGFKTFDRDEVAEIISETYKKTQGRYPYMSDVLEVGRTMMKDNNDDSTKFFTKLKRYTRQGDYPFFDRDSTINIENDVILADLKGLETEPSLQKIYTLLISQVFNNKMYGIRGRRKVIIRDEAWSIMSNESARRFFVEDLRTARKNGFATISISQLPNDYMHPDPQSGRAIMTSMQVNMFCKFESASLCEEIGHEYKLSDEMIDEMTNLGVQTDKKSGKRTHSKFMMLIGKEVYVLNNYLHPFEYQLYSSSADDNNIIDYYLNETGRFQGLEQVLWFLSENSHIGDENLLNYMEKAGAATEVLERLRGRK